jgi:hypothetical protein
MLIQLAANPFISATSAPFVIGLAYANMVWGFGAATISTNLARDLGTRIVAAIFFGGDAFGKYAAIAILANVPATLFATAYYELLMRDSMAKIAKGHGEHEEGDQGLVRYLSKVGAIDDASIAGNTIQRDYANGNGYSNGRQKETLPV